MVTALALAAGVAMIAASVVINIVDNRRTRKELRKLRGEEDDG